MASGSITSWQIDGERVETVIDFSFLGSKIIADATVYSQFLPSFSGRVDLLSGTFNLTFYFLL